MKFTIVLVSILMLACLTATQADQLRLQELRKAPPSRLKVYDLDMSSQDYHDASRHNRRMVRKTARVLFEGAMSAVGLPERAATVIAPAVGLLTRGGKLNINEDKTFALELDEVASGDRSLRLQMRFDW